MATTTLDWERVTPNDATPPFMVYKKPINKSPRDDREYRVIQLQNGLQATLIHDLKADKAAASLDVAVGHLSDPDDMPGLAHFCEHLLFMGTEQFPRENEYSEYLAHNNGNSNAFTATTNTNYHFSVSTQALPGALERFASFFHSPLFAPSCTSRELNAVNSEHKKNHQSDIWRIYQLNKHLSRPDHPWRKFGSGSRDSLLNTARLLKAEGKLKTELPSSSHNSSLAPSPAQSRKASPAPSNVSSNSEVEVDGGAVGRETRRRLVEWWNDEYCASRMRLCVVGQETLDDLSALTSKLFSPIPNRGKDPLPTFHEHPFGSEEKGTLISVATVLAFHALEVSFPLEYQPPLWKYKPIQYISHLLGHEGPGSLLSYLKGKGWVTTISTGPQSLARGFAMFKITVYLTPAGFENHRAVILAVFKYLSLVRASKLEAFRQQELAALSSLRFNYTEKGRPDDYAITVTDHMSWPVDRDSILTAPRLIAQWGGDGLGERKVREYLDSFQITEGRVVLMAKAEDHKKYISSDAAWEKEPWYGTNYRVEKFGDQFIQESQAPNNLSELYLPGPNEFIPTNLHVEKREVSEPSKRPFLIRQTPLSTLWHKKDDKFWVPKAHVHIDLRSPACNASPRAAVMTRLYSDLVNDSLTEYSYDASLAGLAYNFTQIPTGLYVSINGYNDKVSTLVQHVLEKIKHLTINPARLEVLREQARQEWENFFLSQPYTLSDYYGRYLLSAQQWAIEDRLKELPTITKQELETHIKTSLTQGNIRMLVAGNIYKDEAIRLAELAEQGLGQSPLSPAELNDKCLILPNASNFVWSGPVVNPNQANSSLTYYLHVGSVANQRLRVTHALLTQILTEPAFNVLRTQEQLGYVVSCSSWPLTGSTEFGVRIVVQSEKMPTFLETRVEAFLNSMQSVIEEMDPGVFDQQKKGLTRKWLEADKNLTDETARFVSQVSLGQLDFMRAEKDAKLLQEVAKDEVLALFLSHIHPSSQTRRKLSVHLRSQKPRPTPSPPASDTTTELTPEADVVDEDPPIPQATFIKDMKAFKQTLDVSVDPGPLEQWGDLPISRF